jgi:hypothetical protein
MEREVEALLVVKVLFAHDLLRVVVACCCLYVRACCTTDSGGCLLSVGCRLRLSRV